MTSSEWATWVQAIGSIIAIFGAAGIAIWQSRKQHKSSLELLSTEHRLARTEVARALLSLSTNSLRMLKNYAKQLPDRGAVHKVAEGVLPLDLNELKVVEGAVRAIPLHSLPIS
jgi:Tfp pilus assembly protein FimT